MSTVNLSLKDYVKAGYPGIVYNTSDENRAIDECLEVSRITRRTLYVWSLTKGIYQLSEKGKELTEDKQVAVAEDVPPDESALNKILSCANDTAIYCMLDFHPFIKDPIVWRTAKDCFEVAKENGISYIFISNHFEVPKELEHELIVIDMELPSRDELKQLILALEESLREKDKKIQIDRDCIDSASEAALGLTLLEAENAFSTAITEKEKGSRELFLDVGIINDIKRIILCKDGLLEYYAPKESLEDVGGMREFIEYASKRFSAYSEEARTYGLPYPKGVLLVGIPGCGKSLIAKALANKWKKPLLQLDLGKLFGSFVGDTEANTRKALKTAEAMAPAILWLDEIDKGLSGVGGSGKTDSGVTSRMFGTILTWLQEKEAPVYVIATANNISSLPQELLRKGRFDEIFFVDLPNEVERAEIFRVLIKKHKGAVLNFDIEKLAKSSDGYNGAEIDEAIISGMHEAWSDNRRPYTTEDIESAMAKLIPASQGIMSETVEMLRKWSISHGIRKANNSAISDTIAAVKPKRKATRTISFGEDE